MSDIIVTRKHRPPLKKSNLQFYVSAVRNYTDRFVDFMIQLGRHGNEKKKKKKLSNIM